jgi:hypothetical protein
MHHFGVKFLEMISMMRVEFTHFLFFTFADLLWSFPQHLRAVLSESMMPELVF